MRKCLTLLGIVVATGFGSGKVQAATDEVLAKMDGDVIGRFHFAGTARIAADPAAKKLNELGALPATVELRESVLQKLSTTPFRLFQKKLANPNGPDFASLLRPLLDDLLREESYIEMRGPGDAVPELMLAVHLSNDRATVWRNSLANILPVWTGIPVKNISGDGYTGWELKKHEDPNLIRFLRAGDWVLFGWGENEIKLQAGFLERIKQTKRPVEAFKENWLDAQMDWPAFMRYHPFTLPSPLPARLPRMHLTIETKKDYLRPKLVMQYPEPLNLKLHPWQIPIDTIHNPISSFAAARGIGPWLSQLETVKKAQISSVPNQITIWSMAKLPFGTYAMAPEPGANKYVAQIAPGLISALNAEMKSFLSGKAEWTNQEVVITKLPFMTPFLRASHDSKGDFVMAGVFPFLTPTNAQPFPRELLREVESKPDLVYYGWEINEERIMQWESLSQVNLMIRGMPFQPQKSPGVKWLQDAKSKLGNCGTVITLSAPNELTLVRNAPIGFTGLELTALEYWVDSPGFPLHATYPKPMPPVLHKQPEKK